MSDENDTIEVTTAEDFNAVESQGDEETTEPDSIDGEENEENDDSEEGEENEEIEGEENEGSEKKDKKNPNVERKIKSRIARLKQKNEQEVSLARQEAEYWKRKALGEKDETSTASDKKTTQQTESKKPAPDDFETDEEYIEALTDWKTDQKLKDFEGRLSKKEEQSREEKQISEWNNRVKTFAEKTADFAEVLENVEDVVFSPVKIKALQESDAGPELLYEIAKNPELAEKIEAMSDIAAVKEIGRLESRLTKSSHGKKPVTQTKTKPKPISTVGGRGGKVTRSIYDPETSQAEFERQRREDRAKKRA